MSFTKGFWVTIIILTLNRLQDTQRTPWAGSRAEKGGINHPQLMLPPITSLSNMSLSFRPRQPDQTQQENSWAFSFFIIFWAAEYNKKCFLKLPQSAEQPLNGEMPARGSAERWLRHFHSSRPQPPPRADNHRSVPGSQGGRNWKHVFHWSTAWISWIPLLHDFLSISWSENTVRGGRKGDGAGRRWGGNPVSPLWPRRSQNRLEALAASMQQRLFLN